jgi:membrane-bound ClpP family serine protease
MVSQDPVGSPDRTSEEWRTALPEEVPEATYAPVFLALGIIFLLFGIISSYVFSAAGVALMVWSISKWIGELLGEERSKHRGAR